MISHWDDWGNSSSSDTIQFNRIARRSNKRNSSFRFRFPFLDGLHFDGVFMIQVHFSGIADWFTKGKNGQSHPRIETVSWIEYDSYQRKYVHITPDNIRFGDNFILTKEDERKYREKEIRHKKHNIDFDKNNLNFVNELQILPDPLQQSELDDIEESGRHYLKIRKYKNFVPNFKDELDYIL